MHTLTITDDERDLLIELLATRLKELSHEIHQTDSNAYREGLANKQNTLEQVVSKLQKS
jgi:metal-dependent HD superfamily phosphatase/phosphodiesterase